MEKGKRPIARLDKFHRDIMIALRIGGVMSTVAGWELAGFSIFENEAGRYCVRIALAMGTSRQYLEIDSGNVAPIGAWDGPVAVREPDWMPLAKGLLEKLEAMTDK